MAEDGKQPEVDDGTHSEVARIPYDPDRKIYEADDVAASEVDLSELPDDSPRDTMEEYDRDLAPGCSQAVSSNREGIARRNTPATAAH
jgi:hypothetical protein